MKMLHERTYEVVASNMTDAQIGARKKKSVRNHIFILNTIVSDVLSSKKKNPIDLNVIDFSQMFDAEDLSICLNSLYEAGVKDDNIVMIYEANKTNVISVKTPNGITDKTTIYEKIMQGDVLSPLVSSNMVDRNIGISALITGNIYMYKNKIPIPPLMMQDDTLGISECGFKSKEMNNFLNTRTNIMNLQFGSEKCEKIHIGKKQNKDICSTFSVDSWKEIKVENCDGVKILEDIYN